MSDYETASSLEPLQYSCGGWVTHIGSKALIPPPSVRPRNKRIETKQYIQGYAIRWRTLIHLEEDKYAYFLPGSIKSLMTGPIKPLHFDHDESITISTTRDGLVLYEDGYGIALRLHVPQTPLGEKAASLVGSNDRQALSVGVNMYDCDHKVIDGVNVRIVNNANLLEVSLVYAGKCGQAYAILVDADTCGTLDQDSKSGRLMADSGYVGVMRALRKLDSAA